MLYQYVPATYAEFDNHNIPVGISGDEIIERLLFVGNYMIGDSCQEGAFQLPHPVGIETRQFEVCVSIGGYDEIRLVADDASQIFHHIRRLIVRNPVFYQSFIPSLALICRGIVEETTLKYAPYAIFVAEVSELGTEHIIVGENIISLGNGESVACSYYQRVGIGDSLTRFIYIYVISVYPFGVEDFGIRLDMVNRLT